MRDAILPCVGDVDSLTAGIREVSLYLLKTLFHDNGDPRYRAARGPQEELQFYLELEEHQPQHPPQHPSQTPSRAPSGSLDEANPPPSVHSHSSKASESIGSIGSVAEELQQHNLDVEVPPPTARQGAVIHGDSIGPQVVPATAPTVDTTSDFIDQKMAELAHKYAVREAPFARDLAPGYSSSKQGFLRKLVHHDGSVYKIVPPSNDFAKNSIFHELSIYEILQRAKDEVVSNHVMVYDSVFFMDSAFIYKMEVCKPILGSIITISDLSTALATAVGFLHERRIAHLDIKLDNVLVNDNGVILLTDYDQSVPFTVSGEDVPRLIFGGGTIGHRWLHQMRDDWKSLDPDFAFLFGCKIDATSMCVTVLDAWILNALRQLKLTSVRSIGVYHVAIDDWIGPVEDGLTSLTNKEAATDLLRTLRDLTRSSPTVVKETLHALRNVPRTWDAAPSAPATLRLVGGFV